VVSALLPRASAIWASRSSTSTRPVSAPSWS
jgi:hypothetical protein